MSGISSTDILSGPVQVIDDKVYCVECGGFMGLRHDSEPYWPLGGGCQRETGPICAAEKFLKSKTEPKRPLYPRPNSADQGSGEDGLAARQRSKRGQIASDASNR